MQAIDSGHLIAINIVLLYAILGPLVLLAIYVLFDTLGRQRKTDRKDKSSVSTKAPALWSKEDVDDFVNRN